MRTERTLVDVLVGASAVCALLAGLAACNDLDLGPATPDEDAERVVVTEKKLAALRFPATYQLHEYWEFTINDEPPEFPEHDPQSVPLPQEIEAKISAQAPAATPSPSPPARCPEAGNASIVLGDSDLEAIQQFLNDGGSVASAEKLLNYHENVHGLYATGGASARVLHQDLTGDSVPDLLIVGQGQFRYYASRIQVAFFSCNDGRYEEGYLLSTEGYIFGCPGRGLWAVEDMTGNGLPEVVLAYSDDSGSHALILEWDGSHMASLVDDPRGAIHYFAGDGRLADVDGNGSLELLVRQDLSCSGLAYEQDRLDVFAWDGDRFRLAHSEGLVPPACPVSAHPGWTSYTSYDGTLGSDRVAALTIASDGALWAGTWGGGASRFDGQTWTRYTPENSPLGADVPTIAAAPDGSLWFGSRGLGILRLDGQQWTTYTIGDGLADNRILIIDAGDDGTVWAGTEEGLSYFDGQSWTTVQEPDLARSWISGIAAGPGGSVWVTAYGQAFYYDGAAWAPFATAGGLGDRPPGPILLDPGGGLWFSRRDTLVHWDGQRWTSHSPSVGTDGVSNLIHSLAVDGDGVLWAGIGSGIGRFDGQDWRFYPLPAADRIASCSTIAPAPDGAIWCGTGDEGLYRYLPATSSNQLE